MTDLATIARALDLAPEADAGAIVTAITGLKTARTAEAHSQIAEIGVALGVEGGDAQAVLAAARTAGADATTLVPALQSQVTELSGKLQAIEAGRAREQAERFVDAEIAGNRAGLSAANRAQFVEMHMENPTRTEALIKGFAQLGRSHATAVAPAGSRPLIVELNAEEIGRRARKYQADQAAAGSPVDWTTAVLSVSEENV